MSKVESERPPELRTDGPAPGSYAALSEAEADWALPAEPTQPRHPPHLCQSCGHDTMRDGACTDHDCATHVPKGAGSGL